MDKIVINSCLGFGIGAPLVLLAIAVKNNASLVLASAFSFGFSYAFIGAAILVWCFSCTNTTRLIDGNLVEGSLDDHPSAAFYAGGALCHAGISFWIFHWAASISVTL